MTHDQPIPQPLAPGVELDQARSLALRYLIASTVILGASGLLGVMLRQSQAGLIRIDPGWWYALMTAHGLGAFLGWAGFAVMGLAFWVLAQIGFPLSRLGYRLAAATWWLMVIGVAGVVVTCLIFKYGGSWVFLYPISFHGAGQWGKWTAFFFTLSVLAAGLAILTWCAAILTTVLGPALHSVSKKLRHRIGLALGFGYLSPSRFATNPTPVPFAIIPLTVIAIDMIIATIPFALLLIEMMVQALSPGVHVDPLLAKNVLWFFGHPVVYLLLFPTVAIYYALIPRYAGRPLVAGNIVSVGWAIAVVANVIIWAHHIYIDYPAGSPQATLNTVMQPLTFSVTIVSALSLYSLFFTMYRSRFQWNAASTALVLGLASWLLAGFSGLINATIAFDQIVHNTLWVVGHFHQMALLGIGLPIIAATYAWLPEFIGKPLFSETMARWHVWLTFIFGTVNSAIWIYQGLLGAPRRYAVLPARYAAANQLALPITLVLGAAQLLFAWNIIQTFRGKGAVEHKPSTLGSPRAIALGLAVLFAASVGGWGAYRAQASSPSAATTTTTTAPHSAAYTTGEQIFNSAGCSGCHTLAAAGAAGTVGPNLDQKKPAFALVVTFVTNGKKVMPSFRTTLSAAQIKDVATFVSQADGSG